LKNLAILKYHFKPYIVITLLDEIFEDFEKTKGKNN